MKPARALAACLFRTKHVSKLAASGLGVRDIVLSLTIPIGIYDTLLKQRIDCKQNFQPFAVPGNVAAAVDALALLFAGDHYRQP